MVSKPTKTTNRIHFTDLDPIRFEDLCLALLYPLHPWLDIRHYGRTGGDGGVDIFAKELVENDQERNWFIQCRRYKSASEATLKKAVDDTLGKSQNPPEVLLVVIACDVRRKVHESYIEYAGTRGIQTPLLWTASILEAALYNKRKDLLFSYFRISTAIESRKQEMTISRNISIKKLLRKELLKETKMIDLSKEQKDPSEIFNTSQIIIHSIDDSVYPSVTDENDGISGWFKLKLWGFYYNGLEFILSIDSGLLDKDGYWTVINYNQSFDTSRHQKIELFKIAQIPFQNIVDIDKAGDEYYSEPHLYCRFANGGEPYEGFKYVMFIDDCPFTMESNMYFELVKS